VLLHGAGAEVELAGNFFVAAALNQQVQHLLVARCNLYRFQIDRDSFLPPDLGTNSLFFKQAFRHFFVVGNITNLGTSLHAT
jgi:hypothetical protein